MDLVRCTHTHFVHCLPLVYLFVNFNYKIFLGSLNAFYINPNPILIEQNIVVENNINTSSICQQFTNFGRKTNNMQ